MNQRCAKRKSAMHGKIESVVAAILETARTGVAGDGIIAVLPVSALYRIREGPAEPMSA